MGLSALPASSRVYLDANIWIYALEGYAAYAAPLKRLFAPIDTGEITAITSALTLAEVLVSPSPMAIRHYSSSMPKLCKTGPRSVSSHSRAPF